VEQVYRKKDNGTMATRPKAELKSVEDQAVRGKDEERTRGRDGEGGDIPKIPILTQG
jgi:hypothetical protein